MVCAAATAAAVAAAADDDDDASIVVVFAVALRAFISNELNLYLTKSESQSRIQWIQHKYSYLA